MGSTSSRPTSRESDSPPHILKSALSLLHTGKVVLLAVPSDSASVEKILKGMKTSSQNVAYNDLYKICEHYFGPARQTATSHAVFKTPWPGDPRVNIQNDKGKAKAYQVRQVLAAIEKKEAM